MGQMTSHVCFLSGNNEQAELSVYKMWRGGHLRYLSITVYKV